MHSEDRLFDKIFRLFSATTCWYFAYGFFMTWWFPHEFRNAEWIKIGVGILVLEFILIHSGGLFSAILSKKLKSRWKYLILLFAFYSIFVIGFSLAFNDWNLFWAFLGVSISRIGPSFWEKESFDDTYMKRRVAVSALLYLLLVFMSVFVPYPKGELSYSLVNQVWPDRGSGVWELKPHQAIATGFIYFTVLGFVELFPPGKRWYTA